MLTPSAGQQQRDGLDQGLGHAVHRAERPLSMAPYTASRVVPRGSSTSRPTTRRQQHRHHRHQERRETGGSGSVGAGSGAELGAMPAISLFPLWCWERRGPARAAIRVPAIIRPRCSMSALGRPRAHHLALVQYRDRSEGPALVQVFRDKQDRRAPRPLVQQQLVDQLGGRLDVHPAIRGWWTATAARSPDSSRPAAASAGCRRRASAPCIGPGADTLYWPISRSVKCSASPGSRNSPGPGRGRR